MLDPASWYNNGYNIIVLVLHAYRTPEEFNALPAVSNDQGVAYNRARCKPVFKSYGKSAGCFDLGTSSDSLTDETSPEDPFYIGMMTNKNAGNPFHKYLVRYTSTILLIHTYRTNDGVYIV